MPRGTPGSSVSGELAAQYAAQLSAGAFVGVDGGLGSAVLECLWQAVAEARDRNRSMALPVGTREGLTAATGALEGEAWRRLGMVAAQAASVQTPIAALLGAVGAACRALRGCDHPVSVAVEDAAIAIVAQSYVRSAIDLVDEAHAACVDRAQSLIRMTPTLPALLLTADPTSAGIEDAFARLLLLCVRMGATAVIVDVTGLVEACQQDAWRHLDHFLARPELRGRRVWVVADIVSGDERLSSQVVRVGRFEEALGAALAHERATTT